MASAKNLLRGTSQIGEETMHTNPPRQNQIWTTRSLRHSMKPSESKSFQCRKQTCHKKGRKSSKLGWVCSGPLKVFIITAAKLIKVLLISINLSSNRKMNLNYTSSIIDLFYQNKIMQPVFGNWSPSSILNSLNYSTEFEYGLMKLKWKHENAFFFLILSSPRVGSFAWANSLKT